MINELFVELVIWCISMYNFVPIIYALFFKNVVWFVMFHYIKGYSIPLSLDLNQKVFVALIIKDGEYSYK